MRDVFEVEANLFAMELLMPEAWLREDVPNVLTPMDSPRIEALAKRYDVDIAHMTMRLVGLGLLK